MAKRKWTFAAIQAEAAKYSDRTEFRKEAPSAYVIASREGWLKKLNLAPPKRSKKWTYEAVKAEAKKYPDRTTFHRGSPSACVIAYRKKWMDDFFPR